MTIEELVVALEEEERLRQEKEKEKETEEPGTPGTERRGDVGETNTITP